MQSLKRIEWRLFAPAILISLAGLVTMDSFSGDHYFFLRQSVWIILAIGVFYGTSQMDWRFLRQTRTLVTLFALIVFLLILLFALGHVAHGAESWFSFGGFALQPSDPAKIIEILILAKYFSRRHIEIANIEHIFISGFYALVIFLLVFLQPDFGGAMIIFGIWLGTVLVSGISKKHLLIVIGVAVVATTVLWLFVFKPYQKARIENFLHPLANIHGSGYNAYQSTIAVGSGEVVGKGIGYGTQSKLLFLPEYQTDFIFAAFAEEWGFIGTLILLGLSVYLVFGIIDFAQNAPTNFETLFGLGFAVLITIHILIHAGMNMGLLPVTGIVYPFMSYGGSHLLTEWFSLGVIASFKRRGQRYAPGENLLQIGG